MAAPEKPRGGGAGDGIDHNRAAPEPQCGFPWLGPAPRQSAPLAGALSAPLCLGKGLVGRVGNDRLFLTRALYSAVLVLTSIIMTYS